MVQYQVIGQRQVKNINLGSAILDSTIVEVYKFSAQICLRTRRHLVIVVKNSVNFGASNGINDFLRPPPHKGKVFLLHTKTGSTRLSRFNPHLKIRPVES